MNQASAAKYTILLFVVTIFWGTGFVAVKMALDAGFPPTLVTILRLAFGCAMLFLIFRKNILRPSKLEYKHGVIAGVLLFGGFFLQTAGIQLTIVSNSAFLTTTNVIMVPFISWLMIKKRPHPRVFISVALGFLGVSILTRAFESSIQFNAGDLLCLLSAVCWAAQIAYTERAAKDVNADSFTFLELAVAAVLSLIVFLFFDIPKMAAVTDVIMPLLTCLWLGVTGTGFAFWAQSVAQRHMSSSKAVLIMSLEAVFASLFSVLMGFEAFRYTLALGGGIIMTSILLLELGARRSERRQLLPECDRTSE